MTNDDATRQRLRTFDPAGQAGLSDGERERILAQVRAQGPALVRRARALRLAVRAGAASLSVAAAALLIWLAPWRSEPLARLPSVTPSQPACASDVLEGRPSFVRRSDGRAVLELSERVRAVADADADVSLATYEACTTRIELRRGTLSVHARDLGGGVLEVHTDGIDVRVLGTLFRVAASADVVEVAVEHGLVSVRRNGHELTRVASHERVRVSASQVIREPLPPVEADALRQVLVGATPDVTEPLEPSRDVSQAAQSAAADSHRAQARRRSGSATAESAEELVSQAEARWRAGEHAAARALFRKAGDIRSSTGEAAWLRLARLELRERNTKAALDALSARAQRFGRGGLSPEASWLEVEAYVLAGRRGQAEAQARVLLKNHPKSPQAAAARRLLEEKP